MELTNKNDYRYLAAMDDIKAIGAETPPMLHEDTPRSLGIVTEFPAVASVRQWVVWNGLEDSTHIKGDIYMWTGTEWQHQLPDDASAQGMYMASLSDIMSVVPSVAGRFSTVFTNLLMAQEIIVGKTIKSANFDGEISDGGIIEDAGTMGFALTHAGEQVFNSGHFRGTIDCDVMKVSSGTVKNELYNLPKNSMPYSFNVLASLIGKENITVRAAFGTDTYLFLDNKYKYYPDDVIYVTVKYERGSFPRILTYLSYTIGGKTFLEFTGGSSKKVYYDVSIVYIVDGVTTLLFDNLPIVDPHTYGMAWNDSGTLKISNG